MNKSTELNVNGVSRSITADEDTPLIYILRNDLKLKGTRHGCSQGVCGCCSVLMDGRSIQSCNTPLSAAAGRRITTIEGLGTADAPHALQQAFIDEQAGQCGYCLAGMIVGAAALLERNSAPSDAEIREALELHLCRCGSYERILRAVRRASQAMQKNRSA